MHGLSPEREREREGGEGEGRERDGEREGKRKRGGERGGERERGRERGGGERGAMGGQTGVGYLEKTFDDESEIRYHILGVKHLPPPARSKPSASSIR